MFQFFFLKTKFGLLFYVSFIIIMNLVLLWWACWSLSVSHSYSCSYARIDFATSVFCILLISVVSHSYAGLQGHFSEIAYSLVRSEDLFFLSCLFRKTQKWFVFRFSLQILQQFVKIVVEGKYTFASSVARISTTFITYNNNNRLICIVLFSNC